MRNIPMGVNSMKSSVAWINYYGIRILDFMLLFGGKVIGRIILPVHLTTKFSHYILQDSFYPESERKSTTRIFIDQIMYILWTGEINKNYFSFGFDRKAKNDFGNYVPWLTFTQTRNKLNQKPNKPVYDPHNAVVLLRDKFVFEAFFRAIGIDTPLNIAVINHGSLYIINKRTFVPIKKILNIEVDSFCKKNVSHGGGMSNDILRLVVKNRNLFINGVRKSITEFEDIIGMDNWIIQERINDQHKKIAVLHPDSVNTVRVVSVRRGGTITILCALLRIGVDGKHNDNWSSGGIVVGVKENGMLEKYGFQKAGYGRKIEKHPNSEIEFRDLEIPFWGEILNCVKRAHNLCYGLHSVGWDVCVTEDGPLILEGNDNWETTFLQLYSGAKEKFDQHFKN